MEYPCRVNYTMISQKAVLSLDGVCVRRVVCVVRLLLLNVAYDESSIQAKREAIELMWKDACACDVETMDFSITPRDKRWFCDHFLRDGADGHGIERNAFDSVWDLVELMSLSRDPLSIIAAIPSLRSRYWSTRTWSVPAEIQGQVANHLVLGESEQEILSEFVRDTLRAGVASAASGTTQLVVVTDAGQDLDDEMAFVLTRALQAAQQVELKGAFVH